MHRCSSGIRLTTEGEEKEREREGWREGRREERDGGKEGGRDGGHRCCNGIRLTTEDEEREGGMEGVREGTSKGWREREEVEGGREVEKPGTDAAVVSGLLTLGTHARGLQYLVCLSVCVCFPYSGTSCNQAYKQQYQRLQRDTGMKYKNGFFFKMLHSEVMASFAYRDSPRQHSSALELAFSTTEYSKVV